MTRFPLRSYFTLRLRKTRSSSSDYRRRAATRTNIKNDTFYFKATFTFRSKQFFFPFFKVSVWPTVDRNRRTRQRREHEQHTGKQRNPFLREINLHYPLVMSHVAVENVHGLDQQVSRGRQRGSGAVFASAGGRMELWSGAACLRWRSCCRWADDGGAAARRNAARLFVTRGCVSSRCPCDASVKGFREAGVFWRASDGDVRVVYDRVQI